MLYKNLSVANKFSAHLWWWWWWSCIFVYFCLWIYDISSFAFFAV